MNTHTTVVHGTKLTYWSNHQTQGTPLLMLHGHGGDHRGLVALGKLLDQPVYIVDLPGFGGSDELTEHTMTAYVKVLRQFMVSQNSSAYDLLGHSLGTAVALVLTARDENVQRLVLVNAIPEFKPVIKRLMLAYSGTAKRLPERYATSFVHARLYNLATFLIHSRQRRDFEFARQYLKIQNNTNYSVKSWVETGEAIYRLDQKKLARKISQKTLLVHGKKDTMTSVRSIAEFSTCFTASQLIVIEEFGHFLPLEQTKKVAAMVTNFLARKV